MSKTARKHVGVAAVIASCAGRWREHAAWTAALHRESTVQYKRKQARFGGAS